jgi:hypothetical protein
MPAYVVESDGVTIDAAMGYDTSRTTWPKSLVGRVREFANEFPALPARFALYGQISRRYRPTAKHCYLVAVGVQPSQ